MRDKLKLIQECMDRAVANQEVAGVIALEIKDGKEIFFAKSGYADIKNNIPISRDNIFRLYSQRLDLLSQHVIYKLLCNTSRYSAVIHFPSVCFPEQLLFFHVDIVSDRQLSDNVIVFLS